jgi:hypothetical protein
MDHLSPQTLAAQALGETDPVTGALAPVITMSTNYEQQADASLITARCGPVAAVVAADTPDA